MQKLVQLLALLSFALALSIYVSLSASARGKSAGVFDLL